MFRGDGQSVEENQEDDQPVENLRLNPCPALPPEQSVPPARIPTEGVGEGVSRQTGEEMWGGDEIRRLKSK